MIAGAAAAFAPAASLVHAALLSPAVALAPVVAHGATTSTAAPPKALAGASAAARARITSRYRPIFDESYLEKLHVYEQAVSSGSARRQYDMMYVHNALLNMFEACGEPKYLERSLRFALHQIALATNYDYKGRRNWSAGPGEGDFRFGPKLVPHLLFEAQACTEMARAARIVLTTPALKAKYGAQGTTLYEFVRDNMVEKWLDERKSLRDTEAFMLENSNPRKNSKYEIDDKPVMMARILFEMDRIVPNDGYRTLAVRTMEGMKARITPYSPPGPPGTLVWDRERISSEFNVAQAPDTTHANRHVYAMIDAYRLGKVITRDDLLGLAKLLTHVMWNRSTTNPMVTNYIDGRNHAFRTLGPYGNGGIWLGWDLLGAFDPEVQKLGDALLDALVAGVRNPTVDTMNNSYGRISLAGSLSRNLAIPG